MIAIIVVATVDSKRLSSDTNLVVLGSRSMCTSWCKFDHVEHQLSQSSPLETGECYSIGGGANDVTTDAPTATAWVVCTNDNSVSTLSTVATVFSGTSSVVWLLFF